MQLRIIKLLFLSSFLIGIFLLIKPIYFYSKGYMIQYFLSESWNEYRINRNMKYDWFNLQPIGKLTVPRLQISNIILDGSDNRILAYGLGKIENNTLIHESMQNIAIAGHRDSYFKDLKNIVVNDEVLLEHIEGTSKYRVEKTIIVRPEEIDYIKKDKKNTLTLITCFPFNFIGNAPQRFIVQCKLVQEL